LSKKNAEKEWSCNVKKKLHLAERDLYYKDLPSKGKGELGVRVLPRE